MPLPRSREGEAVVSLLGFQATLTVPPGAEGELVELVTRLDRCTRADSPAGADSYRHGF